ncbi:hypothetical protein CYMTET_53048, partial [Cymbomonas tetramitiformis]
SAEVCALDQPIFSRSIQAIMDDGLGLAVQNLLTSASEGNASEVERLITRTANESAVPVDSADVEGDSALHKAAENGHLEVVTLLLEIGADVHARNKVEFTPLIRAAMCGHADVVEQLMLGSDSELEARDKMGFTALIRAAAAGHEEVLRVLLKYSSPRGADIAATTKNGSTALHRAAESGHASAVQQLLEAGAPTEAVNDDTDTPLHRAAVNGHEAVVKLLLETGADVHAVNKHNHCAMHRAAMNGHTAVVRQLLEAGSQITAADQDGKNVRDLAQHRKHTEVVQLIDSWGEEQARRRREAEEAGHQWFLVSNQERQKREAVEKELEECTQHNTALETQVRELTRDLAEARDALVQVATAPPADRSRQLDENAVKEIILGLQELMDPALSETLMRTCRGLEDVKSVLAAVNSRGLTRKMIDLDKQVRQTRVELESRERSLRVLQAQAQQSPGEEPLLQDRNFAERSYFEAVEDTAAFCQEKVELLKQRISERGAMGRVVKCMSRDSQWPVMIELDPRSLDPVYTVDEAIHIGDHLVTRCNEELAPAMRNTRDTALLLLHYWEHERQIIEELAAPLRAAHLRTLASIRIIKGSLDAETAEDDAAQMIIAGQQAHRRDVEGGCVKEMLEGAQEARLVLPELRDSVREVLDEVDRLNAGKRKAWRRKEAHKQQELEEQIEEEEVEAERLQRRVGAAEGALRERVLHEWYPESVAGVVPGSRGALEPMDGNVFNLTDVDGIVSSSQRLKQFDLAKEKSTGLFRRPKGARTDERRGSGACVYVVYSEDGRESVLKETEVSLELERETAQVQGMGSPLVAPVECIFHEGGRAFYQMPHFHRGSMDPWLHGLQGWRARGERHLDIKEKQAVGLHMRQLLQAVAQIHQHGIAHRNIKPQNVFFKETGGIALADFGHSRGAMMKLRTILRAMPGHAVLPLYMAPEALSDTWKANPFALDLWAVGIILLAIATGHIFIWNPHHVPPRLECSESGKSLESVQREEPCPDDWVQAVLTLGQALVDENPARRPLPEHALLSPLFMPVCRATFPVYLALSRPPRGTLYIAASPPLCSRIAVR